MTLKANREQHEQGHQRPEKVKRIGRMATSCRRWTQPIINRIFSVFLTNFLLFEGKGRGEGRVFYHSCRGCFADLCEDCLMYG